MDCRLIAGGFNHQMHCQMAIMEWVVSVREALAISATAACESLQHMLSRRHHAPHGCAG